MIGLRKTDLRILAKIIEKLYWNNDQQFDKDFEILQFHLVIKVR